MNLFLGGGVVVLKFPLSFVIISFSYNSARSRFRTPLHHSKISLIHGLLFLVRGLG